jgi:glycosyltransferase involved in cell wall biosynthesis
MYARIRHVPFVIDAHTGVFDDPRWTWLLPVSRWLARAASATIVTNEHLAGIVKSWGAQAVVIASLPMDFPATEVRVSGNSAKVVFISTLSRDEPVEEVVNAAKNIPHISVNITGDMKRAPRSLRDAAPPNVQFTGWLSDEDYTSLLRSATAVMVLTTRDHTMQRGANEAMELEKPLITSDWALLRETFNKGTIHVDNTVAGITAGIETAVCNHLSLALEMKVLRDERNAEFELRLKYLLAIVKEHSRFSSDFERDTARL